MASRAKQLAIDEGLGSSLTDRIQFEVIPLVIERAERLLMGVMPRSLPDVFGAVT